MPGSKHAVLFNQSYHMEDMYVSGPDALKLLSGLGINSFKGFEPGRAKQFVPCNYDGYVIGDVILFHLEKDLFNLVGRPAVHNWVQYNGQIGKYNVKFERDERAVAQKGSVVRKTYRYQLQGPNAMKLTEKVMGRSAPELKFFHLTTIEMAGRKVHALRHRDGWTTGVGVVWPLGRRRSGESRDRRSWKRVRPAAGGREGILVEYARIRMDSLSHTLQFTAAKK